MSGADYTVVMTMIYRISSIPV